MQINSEITVTRSGVHCRSCGYLNAQEVLAGRASLCRHASRAEVARILSLFEKRHRRPEAPSRRVLQTVESQNQNGTYELSVLGDGTFACSCLAFLGSRDLAEVDVHGGRKAAVCKHVRQALPELLAASASGRYMAPNPPTDWQKLILKAFSVDAHERLTNHQAYHAIHGLLEKQGVPYVEFEERLSRQNRITLLPINAFGVEFEGEGIPRDRLATLLTDAGIPTYAEGYNHQTRGHFKVVTDGSIQGACTFELVTPKLFGADGFAKLRTLTRVVGQNRGTVNASCGLHVHVDAWNCTIHDARKLIALWLRIQPVVLNLVPPSRRRNTYCKPVTAELVARVNRMRSISQLGTLDRYWNLNLSAFARHGTFEFRLHSGTFNADKVTSWVIFVLLATAAARAGLDPDTVPQTWPGIAEAIGLSTGTSVIQKAHRYLTDRFNLLSATAPAAQAESHEVA